MNKTQMQEYIVALNAKLAEQAAALAALKTPAQEVQVLVAAAGAKTDFEVQARKDGQPFYSQYFLTRGEAFFKAKALDRAGWKVTRGL